MFSKKFILSVIVLMSSSFASAEGVLLTCGRTPETDPRRADVTFLTPVLVPEEIYGLQPALLQQGYPNSRVAGVKTIRQGGGVTGYEVREKTAPGYLGALPRIFVFSNIRNCNTTQAAANLQIVTRDKMRGETPVGDKMFCSCKVGEFSTKASQE